MTETDVRTQIREFILMEFMDGADPSELTDDLSFEAGHIVDSVGMMDLIMFLEETFEFEVENEEALPDNFDSVDLLTQFILRKRQAVSA